MEIKTEKSLELLNEKSVTVKTQQYIQVEGVNTNVGLPHAKAYINSERGRKELTEEVTEPYLSAILAVWGDIPKVKEEANDLPNNQSE